MKSIFSHAVNAIKTNPQTSTNPYQEPSQKNPEQNDNENQASLSILQRIQLNPKNAKAPKSISLRKGEGNEFDSSRIQKKVIQKDLRKVLSRGSDSQNDWKHDNEFNPDNVPGGRFTVSIRNLSNSLTEEALREVILDDRSIVEMNLDTGRGEIIFSNKESAKRAASKFFNTIIPSSHNKTRAQYVASISLSSTAANPIQNLGSRNVELPNYHKGDFPSYKKPESEEEGADDQLPEEEEEEEKPSILSRIKKNKK